eukprot:7502140-Alexandrium_andersonii.AAC.1
MASVPSLKSQGERQARCRQLKVPHYISEFSFAAPAASAPRVVVVKIVAVVTVRAGVRGKRGAPCGGNVEAG